MQTSSYNLDRVRKMKSAMTRLTNRVQKVSSFPLFRSLSSVKVNVFAGELWQKLLILLTKLIQMQVLPYFWEVTFTFSHNCSSETHRSLYVALSAMLQDRLLITCFMEALMMVERISQFPFLSLKLTLRIKF